MAGSKEPAKAHTACDMSKMTCAGGLEDAINWSAAATITEVRGITSGLDNKDHAGSSSRNGLSSAGNSKLADAYFWSTFATASERMLTRFRRGDMFVVGDIVQSERGEQMACARGRDEVFIPHPS